MAVAGAVATQARGVTADDRTTPGGIASGERTTVAGAVWHVAAYYQCK